MKTFLIIDYYLQSILFVFMFLGIIFFPISMLLLAVLGTWQLLSGIISAAFINKLKRKAYLLKAGGYLFFLSITALLGEHNLLPDFVENFVCFLLFWIFIPLGIGIWYYQMVTIDYHRFCYTPPVLSNTMAMNSPMEKEKLILNS